jgi:hypothetical protein
MFTCKDIESLKVGGGLQPERLDDGWNYADVFRDEDGYTVEIVLLDEFGKVYHRSEQSFEDKLECLGALSAAGALSDWRKCLSISRAPRKAARVYQNALGRVCQDCDDAGCLYCPTCGQVKTPAGDEFPNGVCENCGTE